MGNLETLTAVYMTADVRGRGARRRVTLEDRCPGTCFHALAPAPIRMSSILAIWRRRSARNAWTVVDVREPHEFAAGHVPNALNMPMSSFDPEELPQGKPVVLICQSGGRSRNALNRARAIGRDDVRHFAEGMNGWRSHNGPSPSEGARAAERASSDGAPSASDLRAASSAARPRHRSGAPRDRHRG